MNIHHFFVGKEYGRQILLDFVGSKQAQSGVIWGPLEAGCIICTSGGRHGKKAGYLDQRLGDGSWLYFGQGSNGDQSLMNTANSKLSAGDRSVLLFTTREPTSKEVAAQGSYGKRFTFQGIFNVAAMETVIPESGPRKDNRLLRFLLVPTRDIPPMDVLQQGENQGGLPSLARLRTQLSTGTYGAQTYELGLIEYRKRSIAVRRYALLRASGVCELCLKPSPFSCEDGTPYLEVHHLRRLADDGPDSPQNVAAICPNCHRAVHYSHNRQYLNATLSAAIAQKEALFSEQTYSD